MYPYYKKLNNSNTTYLYEHFFRFINIFKDKNYLLKVIHKKKILIRKTKLDNNTQVFIFK